MRQGLRDITFSGEIETDTRLCRCGIQGTWFSANKRPRVITADGQGWGEVLFLKIETIWVYSRKGEIRNKKGFTGLQGVWGE